jgi:hypothetical protein
MSKFNCAALPKKTFVVFKLHSLENSLSSAVLLTTVRNLHRQLLRFVNNGFYVTMRNICRKVRVVVSILAKGVL